MAQTQTQTQEKRQLYSITRSEATWLVKNFITANRNAPLEMEPYRAFRDILETHKPAFLGKFNNSHDAAVQGTFYAMASYIFYVIKRLFAEAADINHDEKIMAISKHLPTTKSIAYTTIAYLNWAVYNWHFRKEKNITEDLSDNCFENTTCTICDFTGEEMFYYSTAYGLEKPVCESCLPTDDSDYEKKDEDYVVEEEDEEEDKDEEASEDEYNSDDDSDYNVEEDESEDSEESESDESEDDSDSDSDASSNCTEETDVDGSETDSTSADEYEEAEKSFGCTGCDYSWRDGWRMGWRAAMKHVRNYANQEKNNQPDAPRCATCDISHRDLKKCAGQCGGLVRYCSERCQKEHWAEHKQVCRR
jgi:hypothetical protein